MDDGFNELVANMKELDVEEMEEEQLNSELQRDLCFAVLCERMDKRNYRWEVHSNYNALSEKIGQKGQFLTFTSINTYQPVHKRCLGWDYKPNNSRYGEIHCDPKLAAEFILSGKEQFRAFMDFCKSVKELEISLHRTVFYFDKDVCMTESDPVYEHVQKMFKLNECFFIKTLFKYIKRLVVYWGSIQGLESLYPHLSKMQNLEELVIYCCDDVNVLVKLLKMKSMKTIEAMFEVFQRLDKFVENHKLEKMLILGDYKPEDVFKLSNFSPTELHFTTYLLKKLGNVSENKGFGDTKKLFVDTEFSPYHEATLFVKMKRVLSTAGPFIDSVQKQFPKLEELTIEFSSVKLGYLDLNHEENQMKTLADLCADFLKKYQGKLDVNLKFIWRESFSNRSGVHEYMKKQFPDQEYEAREKNRCTEYFWKNRFTFAKNVVLDYKVLVRVRH